MLYSKTLTATTTIILTLAGASIASANWSAQPVLLSGHMAAASVSISQSGFDQLSVSFNDQMTVVTKPVAVTNTGTAPVDYTLSLGAETATALSAEVSVQVQAVPSDDVTSCSKSTVFMTPTTTWGSVAEQTGQLPVGAAAVYCVRASLTSAQILANGGGQMISTLALTAGVGNWSAAPSSRPSSNR